MFKCLAALAVLAGFAYGQEAAPSTQATKELKTMQRVAIETSKGKIVVELNEEKAPLTVKNFLSYVDEKFYDETIFHRVIDGFMIQGGGFTQTMTQKRTKAPVRNEAQNGLSNKRGTLAMARTSIVDSATSQFFINLVDNPYLDFRAANDREFGYCVFGRVVEGMDVVDAIAKVRTGDYLPHQNVPVEPVVIRSIRRILQAEAPQK